MNRIFCNNCGNKKFWKLSNGEYRCRACRRDRKPYPVKGLRFSKREWRKLVKLFLLGVNSPTLSTELKKNLTYNSQQSPATNPFKHVSRRP